MAPQIEVPQEGEATPTRSESYGVSHEVHLDDAILKTLSLADKIILQELDMDGSGRVELTEILGLLRHHRDDKSHLHKLFKAFLFVVTCLTVLLIANSVATYAVVEMSKESKVKGSAMVSADTGKIVDTSNSEMTVDANGVMKPKNIKATGRRLDDLQTNSIKTTPALMKVELASSLPDSVLMGLDEVTVHSDKGHTLQIRVQGFSRVPVLNSRCGNIVNFYTAWKGRITLDSTDLSFDEATAKEFKNAGFSLGVGGVLGRKLAGKSSTDGFFKNMQNVKKSGAWRCAGVPLPTMTATSITRNTYYSPCGSAAQAGVQKRRPDMCDSRYGGLIHGAGLMEKKHALAVVSKTARISALLAKTTPQVIYVKTHSTIMRSDSYQVTIETYPAHAGQERITIFDRATKAAVKFQFEAGQARTHCQLEGSDPSMKALDNAEKDKNVNSDMNFELIDSGEEDGTVLRHFRMMPSDAFTKFMTAADSNRPTDSYTEYWDIADTLQPYRILSGDGSLTVLNSVSPKCSDAEVVSALKTRLNTPIADLMKCSVEEKETAARPTMASPYSDLPTEDADYYTTKLFSTQDDRDMLAEDKENSTDTAQLARYLLASDNKIAMPDVCFTVCAAAVDRLKAALKDGIDICTSGTLSTALTCMETSGMNDCQSSEFVSNHFEECGVNQTLAVRRLESQPSEEPIFPVVTLADGSQEADLRKGSPVLFELLAKQTGMESISDARLVFNITDKHNALYDKMSLSGSQPLSNARVLMSTACNSKAGRVTWMGDGWCMKWDFKKTGFNLEIKWGNIGGAMGLSMKCEACIPILLCFSIPPPLKSELCVGGEISVTAVAACPQIPLTIAGKAYWSISVKADFGIVSIGIGKLEMGIQAATATFNKATRCWWISGEGRRRRRRWWSRRRRNWRACNYRKECDIKVGAYAEITITAAKALFELTYWVKHKTLTVDVTISCYEFWKAFWGGWKSMYSTEVCRYKF